MKSHQSPEIDMRDAFFLSLLESAKANPNIFILTADHSAFILSKIAEELPDQYLNVGIAEQNMVGVAAGLALSGKIVFIYGISPFVSIRVLEHLSIDVASMQLPVNVISVGSGFTYSTDGATHHGLQDVSAIATIPGMTILNSSDPENTAQFVKMAVLSGAPHYIRIEKEALPNFENQTNGAESFSKGITVLKQGSSRVTFVSTGQICHQVLQAALILEEKYSISATVIDVYRLKEFPNEFLLPWLKNTDWCLGVSELYENFLDHHLSSVIVNNNLKIKLSMIAVPEKFYFQGDDREKILRSLDLTAEAIVTRTVQMFEKTEGIREKLP